nr:histidine kinase [Spirochaetota bacterium]
MNYRTIGPLGRFAMTTAAVLILAVFVFSCNKDTRTLQPTASRGELDASSWDFDADGPIPLNGEWEFYWGKLVSPADFAAAAAGEMSGYIKVPGKWNGFKAGGAVVGNRGYATYRLRVAVGDGERMMALHTFDMGTAFRIFVDGREI